MTNLAASATDTDRPDVPQETTGYFGVRGAIHDYSGVIVLRSVDFGIRAGSIHALIGENGSGKSTLIKVLTGAVKPKGGAIELNGEPVSWTSPQAAQAAGISVVHQNYHLFADMSVEHNLLAGVTRPPRSHRALGAVDHSRWRSRVRELFDRLGVDIDPRAMVGALGAAERKFVEIARAMLVQPQFLILDEPTAALEPAAAQRILNLMRTLRQQGLGLAFVSHRLDEIVAIADEVTVLRDGQCVHHQEIDTLTTRGLAAMMIGDRVDSAVPTRVSTAHDDVLVRLREVKVAEHATGVDLDIHAGEIVAVTGLVGSGAETLTAMVGGDIPLCGYCEIDGKPVAVRSVRDAQRHGIGLIPEDRKARGLVIEQSVAFNISLGSFARVGRLYWLSRRSLIRRAEYYREELGIKMPTPTAPAVALSGGNQQKVMLAKLLASNVRVMVVEEPTQGVDIGGKSAIHDLLRAFVTEGNAVLVYSTDLSEVLGLADRVAVFRHGALTHVLPTAELAEHQLAALVVGDGTTATHDMRAESNSQGGA